MYHKRDVARIMHNPFDRATIVSVCPMSICEDKWTLFPGHFEIPAVQDIDNDYEILLIKPSSWFRDVGLEQPIMEVPVSSYHVAESVINDYINGLFAVNTDNAKPGLFFVGGEYTKETVKSHKEFDEKISEARIFQRNWFQRIIELADIMWARTNGNPLAISKDARIAASKLGVVRDWTKDVKMAEYKLCPACGEQYNPMFPICRHCKVIIDKERAKEMDLKFAS